MKQVEKELLELLRIVMSKQLKKNIRLVSIIEDCLEHINSGRLGTRDYVRERLKEALSGEKDLEPDSLQLEVLREIYIERERQNQKWGIQRHDYGDWLKILIEEVGEVAEAMQAHKGWGKSTDANDLFKELIHVSAVSAAIAEQVLEHSRKVSEL